MAKKGPLFRCVDNFCANPELIVKNKPASANGKIGKGRFDSSEIGLVSGTGNMTFKVFPHAFGQLPGPFLICASDLREMRITSAGIRYLLDNDKMRALKKVVLEGVPGAILELVKLALL